MDTQCKDCVFAEWSGPQQIQCEFDRLEKFVDNGTEVVEEIDPKTNKKYFRIIGRICNTCRDRSAMKGIPRRKWINTVRQEVRVRVALVIYVDQADDFDNVYRSLTSAYNQNLTPYEIILIYNVNGEDAPVDYTNWFMNNTDKVQWRIETIYDTLTTGDPYGASIDLAVKSKDMKATYFSACRAGYQFPDSYLDNIDKTINDDLKRFVILLPDEDGNGLFVQTSLYNFIQGSKHTGGCDNIVDKIKLIAGEEGTDHMIKRYEELII